MTQPNDHLLEPYDNLCGNMLAIALDYLATATPESRGRVFMQALSHLEPSWRLHANVKLSDLISHWAAGLGEGDTP